MRSDWKLGHDCFALIHAVIPVRLRLAACSMQLQMKRTVLRTVVDYLCVAWLLSPY